MTSLARFASATREELWVDGRLTEWRLLHGESIEVAGRIEVTDAPDEILVERAGREINLLRAAIVPSIARRVRYVAEASTDGIHAVAVLSDGRHSVMTTPADLASDLSLLERAGAAEPRQAHFDYRGVPLHWMHGSASVLLHEAAGHPAEHGHVPIRWPSWLRVRDGRADLLAGERPVAMRRASYGDLPMCRMTEVRAEQQGAPFPKHDAHVEVLLVHGGAYEPLREEVTVSVAASVLVGADGPIWLPPFDVRERRSDVARALVGARGDSERYPGVVCSREGQEILVGSSAPLIVTVFE